MFESLVSFIPRAVMQGIPLLYGSTGEILTEKSGNLNLGIPGVMYVGSICGVIGAFFYEQAVPPEEMVAELRAQDVAGIYLNLDGYAVEDQQETLDSLIEAAGCDPNDVIEHASGMIYYIPLA